MQRAVGCLEAPLRGKECSLQPTVVERWLCLHTGLSRISRIQQLWSNPRVMVHYDSDILTMPGYCIVQVYCKIIEHVKTSYKGYAVICHMYPLYETIESCIDSTQWRVTCTLYTRFHLPGDWKQYDTGLRLEIYGGWGLLQTMPDCTT